MIKVIQRLRSDRRSSDSTSRNTTQHLTPRRPKHSGKQYVMKEDGTICPRKPTYSHWWATYVMVQPESLNSRLRKNFCTRFRLPFDNWRELVTELYENELFVRWKKGNTNALGIPVLPIELLSLGALRVLGRGDTFDSLEEYTFISEKVLRAFFRQFIKFGSTVLFDRYVISPATNEEAQHHIGEMLRAGYPGAVGSTDATNIIIKRCKYQLRQQHLGHKQSKTARTYNVTVNHRQIILSTTRGHPCTWNDKTLIRFDEFVSGLNDGSLLQDVIFELNEMRGNRIVKRKYRGAWVLTDNGYLPWSVTMPPSKNCDSIREIRWSQWLESMRKDVECTFGMLKKRFWCLDSGIDVGKISDEDNIFLTCCALHNMISNIDQMDEEWDGDIAMSDGNDNFALSRLRSPDGVTDEATVITDTPTMVEDDEPTHRIVNVKDLNQSVFKKRLIKHFDILFQQNKIVWPKRLKKRPRTI